MAEAECTIARSIYCNSESRMFSKKAFCVKMVDRRPTFCMPYFEPIPLHQHEEALKALPALLKRLADQGMVYSFAGNEVHWRHFLRYVRDGVTLYVLVDFSRLVGLLESERDTYVQRHVQTLRSRMEEAAALAAATAATMAAAIPGRATTVGMLAATLETVALGGGRGGGGGGGRGRGGE